MTYFQELMLTNYSFSALNTRNLAKSPIAVRKGSVAPVRQSAVLSREELRQVVLDMVG